VLCQADHGVVDQTLRLNGADFEGDGLMAAAVRSWLDALVTRNPADFANAGVAVLSPAELLIRLR
jgi:hypothetical protein